MNFFVISYTLGQGHDYNPIWQTMAKIGAVRLDGSTFLLASSATASAVYNTLVVHKGLTLLAVLPLTRAVKLAVSKSTPPAAQRWLETHLNF